MVDTEAARNDLRIANRFLKDFEESDIPSDTAVYRYDLDKAMEYIKQARLNDPDVTWQYKNDKKELVVMTPDILEAIVLYHLANPTINKGRDATPQELQEAIALLERSLALRPIPMTYKTLGGGYYYTYQQDKYLALMIEANKKYPEDHIIPSFIEFDSLIEVSLMLNVVIRCLARTSFLQNR